MTRSATRPAIDDTHAPDLTSWVEGADGHPDFPIQNLPLGVFSPGDGEGDPRIGVAIGDFVLDLRAASAAGGVQGPPATVMEGRTLNAYMGAPADQRLALRRSLSRLLSEQQHEASVRPLLHAAADVRMHLPAAIGDYTDFYVGIHHANNIGRQFRPDNPLLPNYKYVPIGYHGRASSIRPSGVPLVRPNGQRKAPDADVPVFGPSVRLDYELELGVWIGGGNALGDPIAIADAAQHIAGFCLLNDWSARDFQAWEYQPLGPFLAKNFQSTISPWVITAEALAPFEVPAAVQDPPALPYLDSAWNRSNGALSVRMTAAILTPRMRAEGAAPFILTDTQFAGMYWTAATMVAHHASNGCNLLAGDLLGSGTVSGPEETARACLAEIGLSGPVTLPNGETRRWLLDGDEVIFRARAGAPGAVPIGFGECRAVIAPAPAWPQE